MRLASIRVHRGSPSRSGATPRHLRPRGVRELVAGYLASAEPDVGDDIVAAELLGRIAVATGVPAMAQGCFASAAQACFDLGDHARGAAFLAVAGELPARGYRSDAAAFAAITALVATMLAGRPPALPGAERLRLELQRSMAPVSRIGLVERRFALRPIETLTLAAACGGF